MNDFDRSYMLFLTGNIINCCWNNPIGAVAGLAAVAIGIVGMIIWRKQEK